MNIGAPLLLNASRTQRGGFHYSMYILNVLLTTHAAFIEWRYAKNSQTLCKLLGPLRIEFVVLDIKLDRREWNSSFLSCHHQSGWLRAALTTHSTANILGERLKARTQNYYTPSLHLYHTHIEREPYCKV